MTTPEPIYRGGIRTLRDLQIRCVCSTDPEDGGHWLWRMATLDNEGRLPMCSISSDQKRVAARRAAWLLAGKTIRPGNLVFRNCVEPLCINPEHARTGTRRQSVQHQGRSGAFATERRRAASFRNAKLRRKFDDETIRRILSDPRSATLIAAEMGVARQMIGAIKRRTAYADVVVAADVFSLAQSGLFTRLVNSAQQKAT